MLKVKGTAVRSTLNYMKDALGDHLKEFVNTLPQEHKVFFEKPIITSDFYPVMPFAQICEGYAHFLREDPWEVYLRLGRASADYGLKTVYRIFLKLGSVQYILSKAPLIWNNYYSEGKMEVVESSKVSGILRITNLTMPHLAICGRVTGWMERTVELSGGKTPRLSHSQCTLKNQPYEKWEAHWEL